MSWHHVNAAMEHHRTQQQQRERRAEWHRLTQSDQAESSAIRTIVGHLAKLVSGFKATMPEEVAPATPQPSEVKL